MSDLFRESIASSQDLLQHIPNGFSPKILTGTMKPAAVTPANNFRPAVRATPFGMLLFFENDRPRSFPQQGSVTMLIERATCRVCQFFVLFGME
jgi:hypothetical protein